MSTITVVKKDGYVAIAADTLTTWGSTKESADYIVNSEKIFLYKENYLGFSGSTLFQTVAQEILNKTKKRLSFNDVGSIFQFGTFFHSELKEKYFLRPDDDRSFETSRGEMLIANSQGIFGMSEYRYVQEFKKFYAHGSGNEYALGAMFAVYNDENKTAEDIAKIGVLAGIEFDDGTGLPITCYTIKLKK